MIANNLNAYNPLVSMFNEYRFYKIHTEPRRDNLADSAFKRYLEGSLYTTGNYNWDDFIYMDSISMPDNHLSLHCDRFFNRDILITNKQSNGLKRPDLLLNLERNLLYNFDTMRFIFNTERTEMYFYENIKAIKNKIRNLYLRGL